MKVLEIVLELLSPDGRALLAAKSYYFGVGGGVAELRRILDYSIDRQHFKSLSITDTKIFSDGRSNTREIICLRKTS